MHRSIAGLAKEGVISSTVPPGPLPDAVVAGSGSLATDRIRSMFVGNHGTSYLTDDQIDAKVGRRETSKRLQNEVNLTRAPFSCNKIGLRSCSRSWAIMSVYETRRGFPSPVRGPRKCAFQSTSMWKHFGRRRRKG